MWRDIFHFYTFIVAFLEALQNQTDSVKKLIQFFRAIPGDLAQNATRRTFLAELAVVVTYGRPLCRLTYYFERSKDMVVCFAREKIQTLLEFFRPNQDLPSAVLKVILTFEPAFRDVPHWKRVRDSVITPVYEYLKNKFSDIRPIPTSQKKKKKAIKRYQVWQLYKFAELLRPSYFVTWYTDLSNKATPDGNDLFRDALSSFAEFLPFLKHLLEGMHGELAA